MTVTMLRAMLVTAWLVLVASASNLAAAQGSVEFDTRPGCPHCAEARSFLAVLAKERSDLTVLEHDVTEDVAALRQLRDLGVVLLVRPAWLGV